jgi:hypothetical protein
VLKWYLSKGSGVPAYEPSGKKGHATVPRPTLLNKSILIAEGNIRMNLARQIDQMAALYSRPFLIFMATSAPMAKARETAKVVGYAIGTGSAALNRSPAIVPTIKVLNPITIPEIHNSHTVIDARALNICGISHLLLIV